ncbi:hypothetical protein LX32DRAFT_277174 [Colletotrichum zoysiae]|uniref:Uncharacterized protein n=1 Tax=Colletotrichum zoysiae TaxID=1216348 RepID=A0AAD9H3Z9_9PEZI|nr:hypothetical protein LX32DRAFT_277174 [Colletotrichum zoysiae]
MEGPKAQRWLENVDCIRTVVVISGVPLGTSDWLMRPAPSGVCRPGIALAVHNRHAMPGGNFYSASGPHRQRDRDTLDGGREVCKKGLKKEKKKREDEEEKKPQTPEAQLWQLSGLAVIAAFKGWSTLCWAIDPTCSCEGTEGGRVVYAH